MEKEKLLYELEYQVQELRKARLSAIKYNNMTIKDFLDLGFDNSFILIKDQWFNLGFKWHDKDYNNYGYESDDFGELTNEQLNCVIEYVDDEISDYDYQQVSVRLINKMDEKYFD